MFNQNIGEKFILGHDDEPDFNDDHTQNEYPPQFSAFHYKQNESQDHKGPKDAFMKAFLANNKFSKFEEKIPNQEEVKDKAELQTEETPEPSSEAALEPSLREFTLLISKLLFHLSQM